MNIQESKLVVMSDAHVSAAKADHSRQHIAHLDFDVEELSKRAKEALQSLIPTETSTMLSKEQVNHLIKARDRLAKATKIFQTLLHATENRVASAFQPVKTYLRGFGNEFQSEALPSALPEGQNNPQRLRYDLYAEQISGTSFTTPNDHNQRTWMYRRNPGVSIGKLQEADYPNIAASYIDKEIEANQLRWKPFPLPQENQALDLVQGLVSIAGSGDPSTKEGLAYYVYGANTSMNDTCFTSADGDLLIVPQQGTLNIQTELGWLTVPPGSISVIPRGIRFSINLIDKDEQDSTLPARGYVAEVFDGHFQLPERGPIGANGLANERDFCYPVAAFEDRKGTFKHVQKMQGKVFEGTSSYSPYNVVAWHGNYAPFTYDLANFIAHNTVTKDHTDPSIFTVLTCPSHQPGVANLDFVIFPPRWTVAEDTFRPPYNHINAMSEFMGSIKGVYDGKQQGFLPGGASLHNLMINHGPDTATVKGAIQAELKPLYIEGLHFMFESCKPLRLTKQALKEELLDTEYKTYWEGLENQAHLDTNLIEF